MIHDLAIKRLKFTFANVFFLYDINKNVSIACITRKIIKVQILLVKLRNILSLDQKVKEYHINDLGFGAKKIRLVSTDNYWHIAD